MSHDQRMQSREELQDAMRVERAKLADGKISLVQYRIRTARIVDALDRVKARRPRYAIT